MEKRLNTRFIQMKKKPSLSARLLSYFSLANANTNYTNSTYTRYELDSFLIIKSKRLEITRHCTRETISVGSVSPKNHVAHSKKCIDLRTERSRPFVVQEKLVSCLISTAYCLYTSSFFIYIAKVLYIKRIYALSWQ
jgi:hypothetical protein